VLEEVTRIDDKSAMKERKTGEEYHLAKLERKELVCRAVLSKLLAGFSGRTQEENLSSHRSRLQISVAVSLPVRS
jgi:hypothetical protein